ncbi:unnamed protein product [Plutella xylostella]|uniref:(diamondback moth) hypothetical protein n=1 Tax=Plutella xylostella TaxID=51655 RepID=A0A8S4G6G3_PLUXY|nr:unnamed protein product [Plutella xylostella]
MQIREAVDKKRQGKFQLINVSTQRATLLKCTEVSPEYSAEPILGMQFHPDLFTFNMSYGSSDARRHTYNMKYKLVETVFELLQEVKLFSFS